MKIFALVIFAYFYAQQTTNAQTKAVTPNPDSLCVKYSHEMSDPMCSNKDDGNYDMTGHPNMFMQCHDQKAYCQECWPESLVFSERCNQCLYSLDDECRTTKPWVTVKPLHCPDLCSGKEHDFTANIADPYESTHYVACFNGVTVGCVRCPQKHGGWLEFNEEYNECLYDGKYHTEPIEG